MGLDDLPNAWLILAYGEKRQYAGNAGYEDVLETTYRYDNNVANCRRVAAGDIVLIRGPSSLLGCARIERIDEEPGTKQRQRCPVCGKSSLKVRENLSPRFRCDKGHVFSEPKVETVPVQRFTALFGDSYVSLPATIPLGELRDACVNWNVQHAMQQIDIGRLVTKLETVRGVGERVLRPVAIPRLTPEDASIEPYLPDDSDTRSIAVRQVRERRGQAAFRNAMIDRYGPFCQISRCELVDLLEAAHIRAYRGLTDHHAENGVLLRTDLHTLFDLDLIAIHPETLIVHVHPAAASAGYGIFDGVALRCAESRPSRAALEARWCRFRPTN